jgi:methyl-accepting chemotaxis protein
LLINDLLLLEESMDSSWNMFFRFEKYMTYVSMVFLLLAALLIDVAVSRWVLRAISNALTSISRAMSEIVNQTGKNEILADQQFASISETATSVQNISASAISSKNNAIQTSGLAFQANALAKDGVEIVEKVHSAVVELKEKMLLINQHIDLASNHSKSIDQIAAQVQSQSEEINMLAINSAIQAMDAGEYGKGFMVLSNEIRELADLSKLLAVQTGERVLAIQQSTASSVTFANNGVQSIETVVDLCNRVNQLFGDLVRIIEKVGKNSQEVAADSNQQSAALIQLNQVALRISEGSQETALHIKETRTSMDNIKLSMQKLQKLI